MAQGNAMTNREHWVSINLPEHCPNIGIFFEKEIAENHIEKFGASPLYGFDEKENWLPVKVFITCGGSLAPSQRRPGT